jgi:hypothetical protein
VLVSVVFKVLVKQRDDCEIEEVNGVFKGGALVKEEISFFLFSFIFR